MPGYPAKAQLAKIAADRFRQLGIEQLRWSAGRREDSFDRGGDGGVPDSQDKHAYARCNE
jgi:hypothetical protein